MYVKYPELSLYFLIMCCSGNSWKILTQTKLICSQYTAFTNKNISFCMEVNQIKKINSRSSLHYSSHCFLICCAFTTGRCNVFQHIFGNENKSRLLNLKLRFLFDFCNFFLNSIYFLFLIIFSFYRNWQIFLVLYFMLTIDDIYLKKSEFYSPNFQAMFLLVTIVEVKKCIFKNTVY